MKKEVRDTQSQTLGRITNHPYKSSHTASATYIKISSTDAFWVATAANTMRRSDVRLYYAAVQNLI